MYYKLCSILQRKERQECTKNPSSCKIFVQNPLLLTCSKRGKQTSMQEDLCNLQRLKRDQRWLRKSLAYLKRKASATLLNTENLSVVFQLLALTLLRADPLVTKGRKQKKGEETRQNSSKLVDPASDHILRSKTKPCMSKTKQVVSESAYGSINEP